MSGSVRVVFAMALVSTLVTACEGSAAKPDGGGDASGVNADGFAVAAGASVLVPAVKGIVFKSTGGGYAAPPPAGAACNRQVWTYTLDVGTGAFTWSNCDVSGTGSTVTDYVPNEGTRTLPATQLDTARAALADVHVSAGRRCGADKDSWSLEVTSSEASLTYGDDFYGCSTMYQHFVVSGDLNGLEPVLRILAD